MKAPPLYELHGQHVSAEIIEAYHEKLMYRAHQILDDNGQNLRDNDEATKLLRKIAHVAYLPVKR